jgi:hypothetical protein
MQCDQRCILFQKVTARLMMAYYQISRVHAYVVPEERVLEVCSAEDYARWCGSPGFVRHDPDRDTVDNSIDQLFERLEAAEWVTKIRPDMTHGNGAHVAAPPGTVFVRILEALPYCVESDSVL